MRLRNAEQHRDFRLREALLRDQVVQPHRELHPQLALARIREAQIDEHKLSRFSSERLLRFLTLLDRDVEIVIRRKARGRSSGLVSVSVA